MLKPRFVVWMISIAMMVLGTGVVSGQNYPTKPIRIFTTEPGGTGDIILRLIASGISDLLGQPVIIENRPGFISDETVGKAAPDGYTLLTAGVAFLIRPLLTNASFDPVHDFSPVSSLITQPSVLVVHPSLPVKSVTELIALAKTRPGEINYGSVGIGSSSHLAAELFKSLAGVNIVRINYKGSGAALTDVMAGQVQLTFASAGAVAPYINSNRLKALAIGSAKPSALLPGLPTVGSALPGYESENKTVMFAPAKTPEAIIKRLNQEVVRVLNRPDVKEKFLTAGSEVGSSSPEQVAAAMKADIARLGKVIKDAGIKAD
jgi:tripartite-type tricarboxylate transporter receptor subunit TctC